MIRSGETPRRIWSPSTCTYEGRTLCFSQVKKKLRVTELILGEKVTFTDVETNVDCLSDRDYFLGCCTFGEAILVMGGSVNNIFAALVAVDAGKLNKQSVHVFTLNVIGQMKGIDIPYLCQVSRHRVLMYYGKRNQMWYCYIKDSTLTLTILNTCMPTTGGFYTLPIRVPGGKLLVAGANPYSKDITLISFDREPHFERIGSIPGMPRRSASLVLVGGRFVIGFGGFCGVWLNDLWVFDISTYKGSQVDCNGEWHPESSKVVLRIQDNILYLIGGQNTRCINSVPLEALANWIQDDVIRIDFKVFLKSKVCENPSQIAKDVLFEELRMAKLKIYNLEQTCHWQSGVITQLRSELSTIQNAPSTVEIDNPPLRKMLQQAKRELEYFKAKAAALQKQLDASVSPADGVVIRFPPYTLPALSFPQNLSIDICRFRELRRLKETERRCTIKKKGWLLEYKSVFSPLLSKEVLYKLFLFQHYVPSQAFYVSAISQVSSLVWPGQILSSSGSTSTLVRFRTLRLGEKLLDSESFNRVQLVVNNTIYVSESMKCAAPLEFYLAASLLNSADPLEVELSHKHISRLRRAIRNVPVLRDMANIKSVSGLIQFLQKQERRRKTGWGADDNLLSVPWVGVRHGWQPSLQIDAVGTSATW